MAKSYYFATAILVDGAGRAPDGRCNMKKLVAAILAMTMVFGLAACGKKDEETEKTKKTKKTEDTEVTETEPEEETTTTEATTTTTAAPETTATETEDISSLAPEGAEVDETKLSEAISYWVEGDYLYFKVKTSAEIDAHRFSVDIVNPGIYLTRDSSSITQCIYGNVRAFAEEFDKEYFDGYYVFWVDSNMVAGLASDDSEWAPGTWSVLLFDEESRFVLGQWLIVLEGGGNYHFEFKNSWLLGAGQDREVKEFDSLQDEVASWFTFKADESYDDYAIFNFNGYYLEQIDPQGHDNYYLMVCPEGDYTTYEEADAVDLAYCSYDGLDYARCPYRFAFEQGGLEPGKYTFVLVRDGSNDLGLGGNVEVQFTAEKKGPQDWVMDFSNAKCPALESKYADASSTTSEEP